MRSTCSRCGKPLTDSHSKFVGMGPECFKKFRTESQGRPLIDMGKAKRVKADKKFKREQFSKEQKEVIDLAISTSANYYTAAMLITLKDELGFGPKRAQRFAESVKKQFDCLNAGTVSFYDMKQAVLEELGIEIK